MNQEEFDQLYLEYREGRASKETLLRLEPFRVDNAVIMAAGMSSRFAPLSYEKPKGLLPVRGEVLIERQIRQLHEVGIQDITIVVGYLKEQFYYLKEKYGVRIIENEDYYRYNNSSTMIRVTGLLKNTYICSSDNYFVENVFETYVYDSYYASVFQEGEADEWGLVSDANGYITGIDHKPKNMWIMMGHVYFSREYSKRFAEILEEEYPKEETKDMLWEGVYENHIKELPMQERHYNKKLLLEFDALSDLRAFDESYVEHTGSGILAAIAKELNCSEKDILQIKAVKKVVPDLAFSFVVKDRPYLYEYQTEEKKGRLEEI